MRIFVCFALAILPGCHTDKCGYQLEDFDCDGVAIEDGDCEDLNPEVHPGAVEICDDGVDNNCNGLIDRRDEECGDTGDSN